MAPTNETVERLNQRAQHHRIRHGELNPTGPHTTAGIYQLFVSDEIATRRNDRGLVTDRGEMVRNRATWTINTIHPDGAITATGKHGTVSLPPAYVAEHVELAYATTGMGAQGRTVHAAITVLDGPTDVRNLYVPMTRGRDTNEAFIAVTGEQTAVDVFAQCLLLDWIDLPALTRRVELHNEHTHRPGLLDGGQLRDLFEHKHRIETTLTGAEDRVVSFPGEIRQVQRERSDAIERIERAGAETAAAQKVIDRYDRPLHRRKHTSEIHNANITISNAKVAIKRADETIDRADHRIVALKSHLVEAPGLLAGRAPLDSTFADIVGQLSDDLRIRSRIVSLEQPDHVVNVIGERPAPGTAAREWDHVAGQLDQHLDAYQHDGIGTDASDRATETTRLRQIERIIQPYQQRHYERDTPEIDFGLSL